MKAGGSLVFLVIFALFWCGIVGVFDVMWGGTLWHQTRATTFPDVPGKVTSSRVTTSRGSKGGVSYNLNISYDYNVDDRHYSGTRYRYGQMGSSDNWAATVARRLPPGTAVRVYYGPANPAEALLQPGLEGQDLMLPLFMLPFNMVALALVWGIGATIPGRFRQGVDLGRDVLEAGAQTRLRPRRIVAVGFGLGALGIAGFLAVFVVAFGSGRGFHPPVGVVGTAWLVVSVLAVGVMLWKWRKIASGVEDWVVDDDTHIITLGSKTVVRLDQIQAVDMCTRVERGSKGSTRTLYAPTLRLAGGQEQEIDRYASARQPQNVAFWLRARLGAAETGDVSQPA